MCNGSAFHGLRSALWVLVACCPSMVLPAAEYTPLITSGSPENRVDLVVIGDGYTSDQLATRYRQHVNHLTDYLFGPEEGGLFERYRNFFNVHEVAVASNESGADAHRYDGPFRDTALGAAYYWDGSTDRLLSVESGAANGMVARTVPREVWSDIDMRVALVNDTTYGGAGGTWATYAAGNQYGIEVAIHELGHSFAGLADEYFTAGTTYTGGEPQEPNATTTMDKWDRWVGYVDPENRQLGPVRYYEGGRYHEFGIYRPTRRSRMHDILDGWNAVSREAIIEAIYEKARPLDDWLDDTELLVNPQSLWVDSIDPDVFGFEWLIDGVEAPDAPGELLDVSGLRQSPGNHTVSVRVYDRVLDHAFTGQVLDWWRKDDQSLLEQLISWDIRSTLPGDYNGNGLIEQADLDLVLLNWGESVSTPPAGWIEDPPTGVISQFHLDQVLLNWGRRSGVLTEPAAVAAVPEPGTLAILATVLGLLGCLRVQSTQRTSLSRSTSE